MDIINRFKKASLVLATIAILSGMLLKYEQQIFYYYESPKDLVYANDLQLNSSEIDAEIGINHTEVVRKIESLKVDQNKVSRVRKYLALRGAPLASEAEFMVKTAEDLGIDYRLVASISIIESSGGKFTYRRYNAWGWGGQGGAYVFSSWKEGIYTVSKGLSKYYYAYGLDTPIEIGRKYNPESYKQWASKVAYVMSQM